MTYSYTVWCKIKFKMFVHIQLIWEIIPWKKSLFSVKSEVSLYLWICFWIRELFCFIGLFDFPWTNFSLVWFYKSCFMFPPVLFFVQVSWSYLFPMNLEINFSRLIHTQTKALYNFDLDSMILHLNLERTDICIKLHPPVHEHGQPPPSLFIYIGLLYFLQ